MLPDPNQLRADAQRAQAQATRSSDAVPRLEAEGRAVAHRVDFVLDTIHDDVWRGGAARTCRSEAQDRARKLRAIDEHLEGWARVARDTASNLADQAARDQRNAQRVDEHTTACQAAQAMQPPQPCPAEPVLER